MTKRWLDTSGLRRTIHAQEEWEWPIALYLYLAGMGAGAFAVGVLTEWLLHPTIPSAGMLLWGPLLVALGAPFLVLDLGKKTRFIRACLNPKSSWAARGFLILSSLIVTGSAAFALALLPDILPLFGMAAPSWVSSLQGLSRALQVVALALSLGTAAYTGVFLKSVKQVPLWNTWSLPVLFLLSALTTGTMAVVVVLVGFALGDRNADVLAVTRVLIPVETLLIVLEGVALAWMLSSARRSGEIKPGAVHHLAVKSIPSLAIGMILLVFALLTAPSAVEPASWPYAVLLFVTGGVVLSGGFMLRYDVVKSGAREQHPMHKMAAMQYNWATYARPEGVRPEAGIWVQAPTPVPIVYASKRAEHPVFEMAFSLFRTRPGQQAALSRVKVLVALYRSWRHPVRLEYTTDAEGA